MKLFINNPTLNRPDTMLTLAVYTTFVVLIKFLLSDIEIGILKFGPIDAGVIGALLTPTLGAYVARKWSDGYARKNKINQD